MSEQSILMENRPLVAGKAVELKLYRAYSIMDDFLGYGQIKVHWFCEDRNEPIGPYDQLIQDFEPGQNLYAEDSINECFTEEEIEQLREYLERVHGYKLHAIEVNLPMPECMPYGAIGAGGVLAMSTSGELGIIRGHHDDYYMLSTEEEYSLPFKVWGYFDTAEPADEAEEVSE